MRRFLLVVFLILFSSTTTVYAFDAPELYLITEPFPPLTIQKENGVEGLSIDLLDKIFSLSGIEQKASEAEVKPWARAYKNLQELPNVCLFATARTPQREELFKWVGPIAPLRIVLFARKDASILIKHDEQLKKYRIGTVRKGAPESILKSRGVSLDLLDRGPNAEVNIKKLERGRIDLFAYIEFVGRYYMKELNINPDEFETVYVLKELDLYYAFNSEVSDEYILRLQSAYDQIKENGTYAKLLNQYLE